MNFDEDSQFALYDSDFDSRPFKYKFSTVKSNININKLLDQNQTQNKQMISTPLLSFQNATKKPSISKKYKHTHDVKEASYTLFLIFFVVVLISFIIGLFIGYGMNVIRTVLTVPLIKTQMAVADN